MVQALIDFLKNVPVEMITVILATLPIAELRGAIPWALAAPPVGGGLSWPSAYFFAVLGNFLPVIPILIFLKPMSLYLRRYNTFDRFFEWFFRRTRRKGKIIEKYESLGLILFVSIPLPVTGAWTGAVAAFVFGIPLKYAIPCILLGILFAGVIVTLASLGVISIFGIVRSGA